MAARGYLSIDDKHLSKHYHSVDHAWVDLLEALFGKGSEQPSRAGKTLELLNYQFTLSAAGAEKTALTNPVRELDPSYAAAETVWYLSGDGRIDALLPHAPSYKKYVGGDVAYGAYGPRVMPVLPLVVARLRRDMDSRQAYVPIWRPEDAAWEGLDVPCTLGLHYQVRSGELWATTYMRSNDAWLGWPYDVFAFTSLQRLVAEAVGVRVGPYTHCAASVHLYERDWGKAELAKDRCPEMVSAHDWRDDVAPDQVFRYVKQAVENEKWMRRASEPHEDHVVAIMTANSKHQMLRDLVGLTWSKVLPDYPTTNLKSPSLRLLYDRRQARCSSSKALTT
jgi:hypothetical protein